MKISVIFISVLLTFLLVGYFFAREVMISNPSICRNCHFIESFYNKWERSTHHMVPCLKCHEYGPLKAVAGQFRFLVGTYNPRPLTDVPDRNCLQEGCHERRLVESTEIITRWNIVFDHKPHFSGQPGGIKLHCRSCHSDIVQGEHMRVSINVCFLCHLKSGNDAAREGRCTVCHRKVKRNVRYRGRLFRHLGPLEKGAACDTCHMSVIIGSGAVPQEKCFFCHIDRGARYGEAQFVHRQHVTVKQIDCFLCHKIVEHGNIKLSRGILRLISRDGERI
ncbi:MAG: hypothetical protein P8013_12900 [Candidatus Sulfobium sp.]